MGRDGYPLTRPYLSGYPIIEYPLICRADKGQKMADPQGAGRISQMINGTGIFDPRPPLVKVVSYNEFDWNFCAIISHISLEVLNLIS